ASFSGFPLAARLAFLALGPVLDVKLVLMWQGAFRYRIIKLLMLVPVALVFSACMLLGAALKLWGPQ
ncbi:MAG: permease, partial [Acidobacteriota bacterium]